MMDAIDISHWKIEQSNPPNLPRRLATSAHFLLRWQSQEPTEPTSHNHFGYAH